MSPRAARRLAPLLLLCSAGATLAGDQVGTRIFPFLRIGNDARAVSLGGAYSAVADGAEAIEWNPAGIALLNNPTLTSSYLKYLTDMHAGSLSFAQPVGRSWSWGISLRFFTVGDIPRTSVEDPTGEGLGTFSSTDISLKAALAYRLTSKIAVGATGAVVTGTIDDASAFGYSSDVGVLWRDPFWKLRIGAAGRHMGTLVSAYEDKLDPFPTEAVFGIARPFFGRALLLSTEGVWSADQEIDYHAGGEYELVTDVFLRAGYRTETADLRDSDKKGDLAGFTFGLGFRRIRAYRLDYAYASMGDLGGTHRFTLAWVFR